MRFICVFFLAYALVYQDILLLGMLSHRISCIVICDISILYLLRVIHRYGCV